MSRIIQKSKYQGLKNELYTKKRRVQYRGLGLFAASFSISIIIHFFLRLRMTESFYEISIATVVVIGGVGLMLTLFPQREYSRILLNLIEAYELLEAEGRTELSGKLASKKIKKVLSYFKETRKPWRSKVRNIEKKFTENLRLRIIPATFDNKVDANIVSEIINAIQSEDTIPFEQLNRTISAQYEEYKITEFNVRNIMKSLWETSVFKILTSFIASLVLVSSSIYIACMFLTLDYKSTLNSNVVAVTVGILVLTFTIFKTFIEKS